MTAACDINFGGFNFRMHDEDGTDQVVPLIQDGSYEAPLPALLIALARRHPGLVLDVGANDGLYTILACLADERNRVWAFEPYPPAERILRLNLVLNDFVGRVEVKPFALSDNTGTGVLYVPDPGHGLLETSASLESTFKPFHQTIQTERKRLDDLKLSSTVSVIKLDIEGHEHAFLDGAAATVRRDQPFLFVEILNIADPIATKLTRFIEETDYLNFTLRADVAIWSAEVGFDPQGWNHAFVPRARLASFLDACFEAELPVLMPGLTRHAPEKEPSWLKRAFLRR